MAQWGIGDGARPHDGGSPDDGATSLTGHVLVTGATGFVGQALLERLLAEHPQVTVDVLLRPRSGTSVTDRFATLLGGSAFGPWRTRVGDLAAGEAVARRVVLLEGGLHDLPRLAADRPPYAVIFHCAGDVDFRAGLDQAIATNVEGVRAVFDTAAGQTRPPHVIHVSTAYVWADRVTVAPERSVEHDVSWREEVTRAATVTAAAAQAAADDEIAGRPGSPASDRWLGDRLRQAGHSRARSLGWTDVYTYSKALGERVAEELGRRGPLTILRPTIIESALNHPFPGWIDGYKVADPLFAAYAKGRLTGFPGVPESILDVVPVDVVVNAALASARRPPAPGTPRYLTAGTGTTNPLRLDAVRTSAQHFFAEHPWTDSSGSPVHPPAWRFSDPVRMRRRLERAHRRVQQAARLAQRLPRGVSHRLRTRIAVAERKVAATDQFVRIYSAYSCSLTMYDDSRLRELDAQRPESERRSEPLDVTQMNWQSYWQSVHLPALYDLMLEHAGRGTDRSGRRPWQASSPVTVVRPGLGHGAPARGVATGPAR